MEMLSFGTVWNGAVVFAACATAFVTALLLVGCVIAETCVKPEGIARRQKRLLSAMASTDTKRCDCNASKAA